MNMTTLRKIANQQGVKATNFMKKTEVIRAIQRAEGNAPCFQTDTPGCGQQGCAWREDCLADEGAARA